MSKKETIKYGLKTIENRSFSIKIPIKKIENVSKLEIDFDVNPAIKYHIEEDGILIMVNVKALIKETQEEVMEIETAFVYHAIDLKKFMQQVPETNVWKFIDSKDNGLLVVLIGISLSTMRGIVFEKTRGTFLHKYQLPVMDARDFVKFND